MDHIQDAGIRVKKKRELVDAVQASFRSQDELSQHLAVSVGLANLVEGAPRARPTSSDGSKLSFLAVSERFDTGDPIATRSGELSSSLLTGPSETWIEWHIW